MVSDAHGSPIEGDPAVWISMTNDSLTDRGLPTSESQAWANLSLGDSIRSDIAHTDDGGGLSDNYGEESAHGAYGMCGTTAPTPRITILLRAPRSAVLPPSYRQVRVMMATVSLFRKKALLTCTEGGLRGQVEDNSIDHSDMPPRRLHLRRYGLAVLHLRHDDRVAVFYQHPSPRTKISTRPIAQTRLWT